MMVSGLVLLGGKRVEVGQKGRYQHDRCDGNVDFYGHQQHHVQQWAVGTGLRLGKTIGEEDVKNDARNNVRQSPQHRNVYEVVVQPC